MLVLVSCADLRLRSSSCDAASPSVSKIFLRDRERPYQCHSGLQCSCQVAVGLSIKTLLVRDE